MQLHNEDYSKPFEDAHSICGSCHRALHIRFTKPEQWERRKQIIRQRRTAAGMDDQEETCGRGSSSKPIDINPLHKPSR